ncbi:NADH-quinone oxidoreductase subunit NuoE [candidate division KSB1 bacterium]|nr:NADH-quinone oxidoreductase subunit NuoE [candidate division KSB1 bacterium]
MADLSKVNVIVKKYSDMKTPLIPILKDVQTEYQYLGEEVLTEVAKCTNIPLSEIYGVATFYTLFTTRQKGQHIIRFCDNAPCYVKGAEDVLEAIKKHLHIEIGETTEDNKFTLESTSCLGLCAVAPCMTIDDDAHGNLSPEKAVAIIEDYRMKGK